MEREREYRRVTPAISRILDQEDIDSDIINRQMFNRIDRTINNGENRNKNWDFLSFYNRETWAEGVNEDGVPLDRRMYVDIDNIKKNNNGEFNAIHNGKDDQRQYQYGVILPYRRAVNSNGEYIDSPEWAVPQVLQSLYDTVMLPGRALYGEYIAPEEITEAAINMSGGSVVGASARRSPGLLVRGSQEVEQAAQVKMLEQAKAAARKMEYDEYIRLGRTPLEAAYWIEDYPKYLSGHHFFKRKWGKPLRVPRKIMNSKFNVLKPEGISRGQMAKRHREVDSEYKGGKFPARAGGQRWSAAKLGWETRSIPGRLWYGSPRPLKVAVAVGATGAAGAGAGAYYYFADDRPLSEEPDFLGADPRR